MKLLAAASRLKASLATVFRRKQPFMPEELRCNDVFIVSYPKSGSTWVRFLLANALYKDTTVDFHTVHELIPEVGTGDTRRTGLPGPRLLKSHSPYRADYPQVIYILRDGRDVYSSYYYYRRPDLPDDMTFEAFLDRDLWPTRWSKHVRGWINAAAKTNDILVVRFEDLKEDSCRELRRMISFLGKESISDSRIRQAAEASSFENMRRLEQERGRKYGEVDQFMRKGEAERWQEIFTNEARKIFKKKDGSQLIKLGYESSSKW